jgi:hypothetical protein
MLQQECARAMLRAPGLVLPYGGSASKGHWKPQIDRETL